MILQLILAIIFILISILLLLFIPLIIGAPIQPSKDDKIKTILKLSSPRKKDKILDLGSGDGRIVMAFAEKGYEAHGYEINPSKLKYRYLLVFYYKKCLQYNYVCFIFLMLRQTYSKNTCLSIPYRI